MEATFVIIGGGIAGVTCAETLAFYQPEEKIILVSESSIIKTVINLHAITEALSNFDVQESNINILSNKYTNVEVIHDTLVEINDFDFTITTESKKTIKYKYLCLCMGAKPKLIHQALNNNSYIFGIRDTDSIESFLTKLNKSKNVVIVGNGGIASELVYKIQNMQIDWIIKDKHITATFIDPGAAEFLKDKLEKCNLKDVGPNKRMRYEIDGSVHKSGAALGPDWYKDLEIKGALADCLPDSVKIHYETEIINVIIHENEMLPVEVILNNGKNIRCDFIVSATGVEARTDYKISTKFILAADNSIKVNEYMETSNKNIYAAGDICNCNWVHAKQWFPMKLWTQARQMGGYAAKSMSCSFNMEPILQDFCFELFTHATKLFGYKVVLLGLYNGQKLGNDYEILFRMTKGVEYIKFVLLNGRLQGAVLIGDTDLEETCENLILNQIDLSMYKEDLLNPDIDIEDYFD